MFCEKYYKKLLNYAKKDQIWADPNCPYRGSLCPVVQPLCVKVGIYDYCYDYIRIFCKLKFNMST